MERKRRITLLAGLVGIVFLLMLATCALEPSARPTAEPPAAPKPEEAKEEIPAKEVSPYAIEVKPLTAAECARCHFSVFNQIKKEGGKHQIECATCHTKYHVYSPVKQNWNEIMPKCETCHGLFHGKKYESCSTCHREPHAPKKQIPVSAELGKACVDCHGAVSQEVQKYQSKHTKLACSACHRDRHGYVPSCMECHKPHTAAMTVEDCLACHPVHSPLRISYAENVSNELCGSCHSKVYDQVKATASKHGQVACAKCHYSTHRYIPRCEECHGKPHGEALAQKFPRCLDCHIDVHNLPSSKATGGG